MKKILLSALLAAMSVGLIAQHSAIRKSSADVKEGYYRIKSVANGKYLDLSGRGTAAGTKDTHIKLWDLDDGWDRIFQLTSAGNGYMEVSPAHCNHIWDIEGGTSALKNGAKLQLWDRKVQANQQFKFISAPGKDTYYIKIRHSGKYIDASAGNLNRNGCPVQQWDYHGKNNQRWILEPYSKNVDKLFEGTFHVKSAYSSKYWDIGGTGWSTNANSKKIQVWSLDDGLDRKVKFIPSGDGPYYFIEFQNGGRYVDIQGASKDNRTKVVIYDRKKNDNQKFKIEPAGNDRYVIIAKHSNKAIDVVGGKVNDNGTDLHQWDIHKGKSQQWQFIHTEGPLKGRAFKAPEISGPRPLSD